MAVGKRIYLKRDMPDPEIMEQFKEIPASNTADVMGRSCAMNPRIHLVSKPKAQMMVGPAYTVKCRAGDNLLLHAALNYCQEGDVLVVSNEEDDTRALIGEVMMAYLKYTKKIAGIILSLFGVYMIIGTGANIQFLGVLISFIAVIGWAFMSVISRKISNKYSALTLTKVSMLIATVCNIPVSFLEVQVTHPLIQVDLGAVLGLVYMGVVCTAFTNILWNKSLSLLPANTCSAFYPIQTLTSSFLGVVVFHEVLTTSFVLGSAFIIVGVLISLLFKKRTRKEKEVLV